MKRFKGLWLPDGERVKWLEKLDDPLRYQGRIRNLAIGLCESRRTVIDGGAHVGLWTLPLAGTFQRVYAFEPIPETFAALAANVRHLKSVKLRNKALHSENTELTFWGSAAKSVSYHHAGPAKANETSIVAAAMRLDALGLDDVDLIKLDVEGNELLALRGALETIRRSWPVIVIEEKHDLKRAASALLWSLGYHEVFHRGDDIVFRRSP